MNLPPHNLQAERATLGALIRDPKRVLDVRSIVSRDDFYRDAHAQLFDAILSLEERGGAVDVVAVADEMITRGNFQSVGGNEFFAEVLDSAPHSANAEYHAGIVRELSMRRRLILESEKTIREAYDRTNDKTAEQIAADAEERIFSITDRGDSTDPQEIDIINDEVMERLAKREQGEVSGVPSGYDDLDDVISGFSKGSLVILAGRPSMGKTALGMNIVEHAAHLGARVLVVSLEMSAIELGERFLVARARVDGQRVREGNISTHDRRALNEAKTWLRATGRVVIDDSPVRRVADVAANARRVAARQGLDLVVIDYIQLLEPSTGAKSSRQEQVGDISRRLKLMAKSLGVPVLALSQLNRQCEARDDKRPRMSDLRESGSLEQDADLVLMLHRPEFYDQDNQPGVAELIVAKNRNGRTGIVKLTFLRHCMRFESMSQAEEPVF